MESRPPFRLWDFSPEELREDRGGAGGEEKERLERVKSLILKVGVEGVE